MSATGLRPTGMLAAAATVVLNNLAAASLPSARTPAHVYPLLVGLNIGRTCLSPAAGGWAGGPPSIPPTR